MLMEGLSRIAIYLFVMHKTGAGHRFMVCPVCTSGHTGAGQATAWRQGQSLCLEGNVEVFQTWQGALVMSMLTMNHGRASK
jgi:hypothetical protein